MKQEITLTIIHAGEEHIVKAHEHEYRNLMTLLNNSIYLENFGECGGQGRCATCIVKVAGLKGAANTMDGNEAATIQKAGLADTGFRLSCKLLIDENLDQAVIEIGAG
jgi:2Fe-2S ferredoxin